MTDFRGYLLDLDELDLVQNPALGAFALWAFTMAYQSRNGRQISAKVGHEDSGGSSCM